MKTIIVYESTHHGNTKKLVDAICAKCGIPAVSIENASGVDFAQYDTIGIASGIAFGKFYKATEAFASDKLPEGKSVFFLYTCGANDNDKFANHITKTVKGKGCKVLGTYHCTGFDTFGPFRLVGGIAKGHPSEDEINGAVKFYESL